MATLYQIEIRHDGLNKYRVIRGCDRRIVAQKAAYVEAQWNEQWQRKQEIKTRQHQRERQKQAIDDKKNLAAELTTQAEQAVHQLEWTLKATLSINDAIDWDVLKNHLPFAQPVPEEPPASDYIRDSKSTELRYLPRLTLLDRLMPWRLRAKKEATAAVEKRYKNQVERWNAEKADYEKQKFETNAAVDRLRTAYNEHEADAIVEYCELVLTRSQYPDDLPQNFDLQYNPDSHTLIVEFQLPDPFDLPKIKQVKYIQSRDQFSESYLSDAANKKLYDDLIYQTALRTIHELYEADQIQSIDHIVFNGWVHTVDEATGHKIQPCIVSLSAGRDEFLAINLAGINPKACFKKLKGISAATLCSITPIAPIAQINRQDDRFIAAREVMDELDEGENLATMPWEDFEHLVRELFEKEFSKNGGEVKITQASRDRGVDAVAFDPDPIRGGKIIIQAKRYVGTVGVSAVRDLYGTVHNEGANKGILVTTSDYGPDSYAFAKGKPLTLLSGGNLLHLLAKHGYQAHLDLRAAKEEMSHTLSS